MVTPAPGSRQQEEAPERAQPPIRWPRPERQSVGLFVLWAVGAFIALLLPALLVSPTATTAPSRDVWTAFAVTVVGAALMFAAAAVLWRRKGDATVLLLGGVPAFATIVGGAILTASKLTGT